MKPLVIFGTGEIASLAKYYFENDSDYNVIAFTADDDYVQSDTFEGLPLLPFSSFIQKHSPEDIHVHVALSYRKLNQTREEKFNLLKSKGYTLASYVCTKSVTWPDLSIGENCFILENQTIQPTVTIGNNVMIWSGNHIGHGSTIKDHAYISSHVVISGHCTIGERCFLGVNSTIKDFTTIPSDCFITMDSSVAKDMQKGSLSLPEKTTIYPEDHKLSKTLIKRYFFS